MSRPVTLTSRIRIPDGIVHRNLEGESVILNLNTSTYFGLDPVGTRIWNLLQDQVTLERIRAQLLAEYEVSEGQCTEDMLTLVNQLLEKGLVEFTNGTAP